MNPKDLFNQEPVAVVSVVQAGLALGMSFGLHLTTEQIGAILAFTATVFGFLARRKVTPNGDAGQSK